MSDAMQISYSQTGEDIRLMEIFNDYTGVMVDVGAHDGVHLSNSFLLECAGWKCVLVEPNAQLYARITHNRTGKAFCCAATSEDADLDFVLVPEMDVLSAVSIDERQSRKLEQLHARQEHCRVQGRRLDSILEEAGVRQVDVLSVDVEGHEMAVFHGFTVERWKPRVILVEGNTLRETQQVARWLERYGYERFARTGVNDWYAHLGDSALVNEESRRLMSALDRERMWKAVARTVLPLRLRQWLRRLPVLNAA